MIGRVNRYVMPAGDSADAATVTSLVIASDIAFATALENGGASPASVRAALQSALEDRTSDLHDLTVVGVAGEIAGIACIASTNDLASRRLATLRHIFSEVRPTPGMRRALAAFSAGIPSITDRGLYLARIATSTQVRGMGVGSYLMDAFEAQGRAEGHGVTLLHVATDNERALAFYLRRGYEVIDHGHSHLLLRRVDRT